MAKGLLARARYGLAFEWDQEIVDPINKPAYIKAREQFIQRMANEDEWRVTLDADRLRFMKLFAEKNRALRLRYATELPEEKGNG